MAKKKADWQRRFDRRQQSLQQQQETPKRRSRNVPRNIKAITDACEVCGEKAIFLIGHHVIPLRKGGADSTTNVVRLCQKCEDIAHGRLQPEQNTIPYQLLRFAASEGAIGGQPRTTILNAVEGHRQQIAIQLAAATYQKEEG